MRSTRAASRRLRTLNPRALDWRYPREVRKPPTRFVFNVVQMNSGSEMIPVFIDELDHFRRFGSSSDAKKPTRPLTARWCREVLDSHAEVSLPLPRGLRATARQYDRRGEQLVSTAEQYAMTRPASAPLPGTQPASTCSLPGCDPPPSERRGPSHPDQIFLVYCRFSHLPKRNKTWDTSLNLGCFTLKQPCGKKCKCQKILLIKYVDMSVNAA